MCPWLCVSYGIHHGVDEDSVFLRRRLTLGVHVPQTCWSTLNITTSDMIGWSFSKVIPELTCEDGSALHAAHYTHGSHHQVCSYMARHAGGKGSAAWPFWLEFSDDAEVTVRLATVCSPAHGPMGPVLELFEQVRDIAVVEIPCRQSLTLFGRLLLAGCPIVDVADDHLRHFPGVPNWPVNRAAGGWCSDAWSRRLSIHHVGGA